MERIRRIVALMLLASSAGLQPTPATCAMTHPEQADGSAASASGHGHHGATEDSSNASESQDTQRAPMCGLMTSCTAAVTAARHSTPVAVSVRASDRSTLAPIHTSPARTFDPPPPRA